MLLMQYGRASGRRVLDAQKDMFRAQNDTTEALINYTVATLNFYRDTGVLQVRPDGMWTGAQAAGEPTAQNELPITRKMPELPTEQIAPDVQESLDEPAPQIEPEPAPQIESEPAAPPAQTAPIDAEEYITQWMKRSRQPNQGR
jgi:hypothetical protein